MGGEYDGGAGRAVRVNQTTSTIGNGSVTLESGVTATSTAADGAVELTEDTTAVVRVADVEGYTLGDDAQLTIGREARTIESVSGYSWVNQASTSYEVQRDGAVSFVKPGGGATLDLSLRVRSTPTPPYTYTARIRVGAQRNNLRYGLAWRQSSTSEIVAAHIMSEVLYVSKYDDYATFNADYDSAYVRLVQLWLRLEDNNTNRIVSMSIDGGNWTTVHSVGRTDFLTADQIGIVIEAANSSTPNLDAFMVVDHLLLES